MAYQHNIGDNDAADAWKKQHGMLYVPKEVRPHEPRWTVLKEEPPTYEDYCIASGTITAREVKRRKTCITAVSVEAAGAANSAETERERCRQLDWRVV